MSLTQSPPESVQPRNREEIPESILGDNGCTNGCNPVADCTANPDSRLHGCNAVANSLATDNRLNGNEKSLPVARLQRFSGGCEAKGNEPITFDDIPNFLRRCIQCGAPGGVTEQDIGDERLWLHRECADLRRPRPELAHPILDRTAPRQDGPWAGTYVSDEDAAFIESGKLK